MESVEGKVGHLEGKQTVLSDIIEDYITQLTLEENILEEMYAMKSHVRVFKYL